VSHLLQDPQDTIQPEKINLIPIIFRDYHLDIKADLFISTYALSEAGREAQDFIVEKGNWYNSEHLLLAYANNSQAIPDSERIREFAKNYGANIIDINFLPGCHFAFL
jgi:hypothetical protein